MSNADSSIEPAWPSVILTGLCLLAATNGPAVTLSVHILHRPFAFEDWPFDLPIHAVIAVGMWRLATFVSRRGWRALPTTAWLITPLAVWLVLSAILVGADSAVAHRALLTTGLFVFAAAYALESGEHQVLALFVATTAATVASAILVVRWPDLGRPPSTAIDHARLYQGIFANRNSLGPASALAIVSAIVVIWMRVSPAVTAVAIVTLPIDAWMLIGSRSITPVFGLLFAAACSGGALIWPRLRRRYTGSVSAAIAAAAVVVAAVAASQALALLGRDTSLSDRTSIWSDAADVASQRPWLGYGFGAFWESDQAWPFYSRHGGVQFGSAHNSLVEVALGTGWIGAAAFVLAVVTSVVAATRRIEQGGWRGLWWVAVVAFVLVEHASESFVLFQSYILILLLAAACLPRTVASVGSDDDRTLVQGVLLER